MSYTIEEMYKEVCDWAERFAEGYDGTVHVSATEGNSDIVIGRERPHPQNIFVELTESVEETDTVKLQLYQLVNGAGEWTVAGLDQLGDEETEIDIYRDISEQESPLFDDDFEESRTFS